MYGGVMFQQAPPIRMINRRLWINLVFLPGLHNDR